MKKDLSFFKNYPELIMGCDRFLRKNYTYKDKDACLDIYSIMKAALIGGAKGIDVNIDSKEVFEAFKMVKDEFPFVIGIGDPNMNCGFHLDGVPLKTYGRQIIRMIYNDCLSKEQKDIIKMKSDMYLKAFFDLTETDDSYVKRNIKNISLDEKRWLQRIKSLSEYCEYCLFGADYADWLIAIGRIDLLEYQCESIIEAGMLPISVSHWSSITLPVLDNIKGVVGHWILSNEDCVSLDMNSAIDAIQKTTGLITGFRVLRGLERFFSVDYSIEWSKKCLGINHFTVGAANNAENTKKLFEEINKKMQCAL